MTIDKDLIDRLRMRGEEMFTQVSAELMQNPRFMKAMEGALKGKAAVEDVVRQTLKKANIPTRTEFKRAVARIESLEDELAELEKKVTATPASPRKTRQAATRKKAAKKASGGAEKKKARKKAS
jgi:polyhydroxyalkanoate synthesis regulator phasin